MNNGQSMRLASVSTETVTLPYNSIVSISTVPTVTVLDVAIILMLWSCILLWCLNSPEHIPWNVSFMSIIRISWPTSICKTASSRNDSVDGTNVIFPSRLRSTSFWNASRIRAPSCFSPKNWIFTSDSELLRWKANTNFD